MARRTSSISIFAAILAALLAIWAPAALAHHKDDHAQGGGKPTSSSKSTSSDHDGDADSDSGTTYTEDNDTNDDNTPNNVSDDGDNAHPSGKDRSVESGGSGNQGNSESDPDDDGRGPDRSNGGPDKPNGSGGTDLADQDGNNGCGNDDDFEDDNEGLCGGPDKVKGKTVCDADATMPGNQKCEEVQGEIIVDVPGKPCDADATMPGTQKCDKPLPDDVQGEIITQPEEIEVEENPATPTVDAVLGVRVSAAAQPAAVAPAAVAAAPAAQGAVLPFTGSSDLLPLVAVGMMLIAAGVLSLRGRFSSK